MSPYKYPELKKSIIVSVIGIILLTAFVWLIGDRPYDTLHLTLLLFCFPLNLGILLGIFIIFSGTIFYREVDDPIKDISELEKGQTYWISGEVKAIYWDIDTYTHRLLFEVDGIKKPQFLYPGQVTKYVSKTKEINS